MRPRNSQNIFCSSLFQRALIIIHLLLGIYWRNVDEFRFLFQRSLVEVFEPIHDPVLVEHAANLQLTEGDMFPHTFVRSPEFFGMH